MSDARRVEKVRQENPAISELNRSIPARCSPARHRFGEPTFGGAKAFSSDQAERPIQIFDEVGRLLQPNVEAHETAAIVDVLPLELGIDHRE